MPKHRHKEHEVGLDRARSVARIVVVMKWDGAEKRRSVQPVTHSRRAAVAITKSGIQVRGDFSSDERLERRDHQSKYLEVS